MLGLAGVAPRGGVPTASRAAKVTRIGRLRMRGPPRCRRSADALLLRERHSDAVLGNTVGYSPPAAATASGRVPRQRTNARARSACLAGSTCLLLSSSTQAGALVSTYIFTYFEPIGNEKIHRQVASCRAPPFERVFGNASLG